MNEQLDGTMWKNNKTGNEYKILHAQVIECTNGREEIEYVVYTNGYNIFCREAREFYQKFTRL